jgi:hypothetical protein
MFFCLRNSFLGRLSSSHEKFRQGYVHEVKKIVQPSYQSRNIPETGQIIKVLFNPIFLDQRRIVQILTIGSFDKNKEYYRRTGALWTDNYHAPLERVVIL